MERNDDEESKSKKIVIVGCSGVGRSTLARALANNLNIAECDIQFISDTETNTVIPEGAIQINVMPTEMQLPKLSELVISDYPDHRQLKMPVPNFLKDPYKYSGGVTYHSKW